MSENPNFSYEKLLASNAPDPQPVGEIHRARYDFAIAYPDPDMLPLEELASSMRAALDEEGRDLAVYPHPAGYPPLREFVAAKLARDRQIRVAPDDIILSAGSGQAIHMVVETLLDPGDVVFTEEYVYSGTLRALGRFHADVRGVKCDDVGMAPEALDSAIERARSEGKRPKIVYIIPTFQNPQGMTMTLERRKQVLRVCERQGVPILEDDCYVDLRFEGDSPPAIRSLDESGLVAYVGSFSKTVAPGLRMGYLTASRELLDRARVVKGGAGVNQFAALAIHRYANTHLDRHVAEINGALRRKRDAMLAALGENFGSQGSWNSPDGGLYLWLQMPEGADLAAVLPAALEADVGYQPGTVFSPDGASGANCVRLCYGYNTVDEIHEGIARLAEVFARAGILVG